ncbi:MAG: hypothetical protein ACI9U2_002249, partial [Bradymonadia bacterium]
MFRQTIICAPTSAQIRERGPPLNRSLAPSDRAKLVTLSGGLSELAAL